MRLDVSGKLIGGEGHKNDVGHAGARDYSVELLRTYERGKHWPVQFANADLLRQQMGRDRSRRNRRW